MQDFRRFRNLTVLRDYFQVQISVAQQRDLEVQRINDKEAETDLVEISDTTRY